MENRDCSFSYGSDIFYPSESKGDLTISPTVKPTELGVFTAEPGGLAIDLHTGTINLSKSDWGTRYEVKFTACDRKTSYTDVITLSGIDYQDGIYNLSRGRDKVNPFYNAVLKRTPPSDSSYDTPPRGTRSANSQGLVIDSKTGLIDLAATLKSGAFGREPISGLSREFKLYYRLNDSSKQALTAITLSIYYYKLEREIPKDLQALLKEKQRYPKKLTRTSTIKAVTTASALCALGLAVLPHWDLAVSWEQLAAGFTILATGGFFATAIAVKPRPPYIVIVEG